MKKPKRILVAPLNWGLGHATRCIPIINTLIAERYEVLLASDGRAMELLKKEFPGLPVFKMPAYDIRYTTSNMFFNIGYQLPKIIRTFFRERRFIDTLVEKENIDVVISDNRYGCFSKKTKSIFITHQLNIIVPFRPLEWLVNKINHWFITQFDECWVPDLEGGDSLAGKLAECGKLKNVNYIGPLSRMRPQKADKKYDIIAVLSGPEPQRSHFETLLVDQLSKLPEKALIVQGKTDREAHFFIGKGIEVRSYLTGEELAQCIAASDLVIARSGYSTVMDLVALGKKALLVPTPGQTEQEYLAQRLKKKGIFYAQAQNRLNLKKAALKISNYAPSMPKEASFSGKILNFES